MKKGCFFVFVTALVVLAVFTWFKIFFKKDEVLKELVADTKISENFVYKNSQLVDSKREVGEERIVETYVYKSSDDMELVSAHYKEKVIKSLSEGEIVLDHSDSFVARVRNGREIFIAIAKEQRDTVIIITIANERF